MASLGAIVRYIGAQTPALAGMEGSVIAQPSEGRAAVRWVVPSLPSVSRFGLPGDTFETAEPSTSLRTLRGYSKPFRDGISAPREKRHHASVDLAAR